MESRIAVISIIVENSDSVECLNRILHEFGIYIIGRMGIPYRQRGISIISVAIDAPLDIINALTGKIGRLAKQTHRIVIFTLGKCIGHFRKQLICRLSPDRQRTHQEQGEKQR